MVDLFLFYQMSQKRNFVIGLFVVAVGSALYECVPTKWLALSGLAVLSYYLGDLLAKLVFNNAPRSLIGSINDKAVLITGCDSGFGYELALKLDGVGFKVYAGCLNVRDKGALELKKDCSDRLTLIPLDVTKDDQVAAAKQLIASSLEDRKLWAVVNNAGVACSSEIEWCPLEVFERMHAVNTLGVVRVTKAFLPLLRESQGRVVIIASLAGRVTVPGFTPYSMSKFATVAFADGLRREMKKWSVSVHLVEPSLYKTNIAFVEPLYNNLQKYWDQCSEDVLSSYGDEYLEEFKFSLDAHMRRAKPKGKIFEVVNDMIDAVAGAEPLLRYVPAMDVQFRSRMLGIMPMEMQDHVLNQYSPQIPPAAVLANGMKLPPLKSPYNGSGNKEMLHRHISFPAREKNLPETLHEEGIYTF